MQHVPGYSNTGGNTDLYYDGLNVRISLGQTATGADPVASTALIPCNARFFSIRFFSWYSGPAFDPGAVSTISVATKAYELSQVIKLITSVTYVKDVIVLAHSLGALDTRAYMEGLGYGNSSNACSGSSMDCPISLYPLPYTGDVGTVITLDGANAGAVLANLSPLVSTLDPILGSTNVNELQPDSHIIRALNFADLYDGINAQNQDTPFIAIISEFSNDSYFCLLSVADTCGSDGVLTSDSQSIQDPLMNHPTGDLNDVINEYSSLDLEGDLNCHFLYAGPIILHYLPCLGDSHSSTYVLPNLIADYMLANDQGQLTQINVQTTNASGQNYTGPISFTLSGPGGTPLSVSGSDPPLTGPSVPVSDTVPYVLTYQSGGPTGQGVPTIIGVDASGNVCSPSCYIRPGKWSITYHVSFTGTTVSKPSVVTQAATGLQGDGATLAGTVNPNGAATTVWFEWGTTTALGNVTPQQPIASGTSAVPYSVSISGLTSNNTYYYRVDASNSAGSSTGSSLQFTTLSTLPRPTLLTPASGATNMSTAPLFSWTAISGATSYRIMTATTAGALPTDPTSATCAVGCVIDDTPPGTSYTPEAGVLASGTQYFWQVHARSPLQYGTWSSPIWSFTTAGAVTNDFSLQASPSSQAVNQGGSVTYTVLTTTTSGSSQSIALSVANLPSGVTASFNPSTVSSGSQSILTLSATSSAATGTYSLTLVGTGSSASHTTPFSATVAKVTTSGALLTSSPLNFSFNPQAVDTASSPFVFSLVNTGGTALTISSITESPQFFASFPSGQGLPITLQPNGGSANLQVVFIPNATGQQTGTIKLFNSTNASPLTLNVSGTGVAAPVTTGNIQINATFNGSPWNGTLAYTLTGPESYTGGTAPNTYYDLVPGAYTAAYTQAGPFGATFTGITSSALQTLTAGATLTYTLNFTGANTFSVGDTTPTSAVVGAGASTQFGIFACILTGATQTVNFAVTGLPPGATASFSPNPATVGCSAAASTATITTSATTPPGIYSLVFTGTNQDGYSTSNSMPAALTVDVPPVSPTQLVSLTSTGTQGNGPSGATYTNLEMFSNAVSTNGRYVAFVSTATNLVPNDTNSDPDIFVRGLQLGTTTRVSVASNGTQADNTSLAPSISGDGRYVSFSSIADNLVAGSIAGQQGIYLHDMTSETTTRVDLAPDGTVGNASACCSSISADGRFIAFASSASNLLPSVSGNNVFRFDTNTKQLLLASVASDGTTDGGGSYPQISADGRFVAFTSSSASLVPGDTNGKSDAFLHDFVTGQTTRVNVASDGTQDNCGISFSTSNPIAISADGRYITFISCGNTLVPGVANPYEFNSAYMHDMITGQTSALGADPQNNILSAANVGTLSGDGRFVGFGTYLADQTTGQFTLLNVAADGTGGNGTAFVPSISTDGSSAVFSSSSTNLVANDTNTYTDVFSFANPFLTVPHVTSLTLGQSVAAGGTTIAGSIVLSGPAPTGGATVALSSNHPAAQVPATIFIPAGTSSAPISFSTSSVPSETVMTIVASYNGGSPIALLTLEPSGQIAVDPSSWDFANQPVGSSNAVQTFTVSNSGGAALVLNSVQLSTGKSFSISANTCGSSISSGGNCSVSVTFSPNASGSASDALQISDGSPATIQSISLAGNGATPLAAVSPSTLTFTSPGSPTATAMLTNSGNASLSNISASISGTNAGDFAISNDWCSGSTLPANSSCLVTVTFSPKAPGTRLATLSVADAASGSPQTVGLSGTEAQATPTVLWSPSTSSLTYGAPLGSGVLDAAASVNGNTVAGTLVYTAAIGGGAPLAVSPTTVLGAGAYTLTTTFTPNDTTDYTTATATTSIIVNRANPSITWNAPAAITYGSPLGAIQLNAIASVAGTFVYSPGTGAVLTAGSHSLGATFTPTDNADYTSATAGVSITVNQATPAITWQTPAPITNGTALSPTQLDATASVPGMFVYSPAAGTALASGSHILSVTFTPTDLTDYTTAMATVSITVGVITPTIIWNAPVPITYGSPLTATQLNATASVPGTFVYSPPAGTILGAGSRPLSVTFNPTDTTDYARAVGSTSITVNPASLNVSVASVSRAYGVSNPAFSGSVSGGVNGDTFTISGTTSATISSDVGNYPITPVALGVDISDYTVNPVNGILTIVQAGSATTLSSSNATANLSSPVTFTAAVASLTTGTPTGTVNFFDGQALLGSIPLNSQGIASYTSSSLVAGLNGITAVFMGNTDFVGSTSSALNETIIAPDYNVTANPTSLTVQQGETGTATFTITPVGGFDQAIQFSCSGLPVHSACSFNPGIITPNGAAITSTLTITTDVNTSLLADPNSRQWIALASHSRIAIGSCLLLWVFRRKRTTASRIKPMWMILTATALLCAGLVVVGCGTAPPPLPLTPTGTSSVTIIASTSASNGISHSATLALTITQ
jgi:hypothetical protein